MEHGYQADNECRLYSVVMYLGKNGPGSHNKSRDQTMVFVDWMVADTGSKK